jgi:hypothetical protein
MKKILFLFLMAPAFVACNNNDSNDTTNNDVADSTVNTAPATDNVNGNIPDSTNTIDVGTNDGTVN